MHTRPVCSRFVFLLGVALLVRTADLRAQLPDWVRVGSRLRVNEQGQPGRLVGTLLGHDADSIRIQVESRRPEAVAIALSDITALELSRERGNRAVRGAVFGALALGLLGGYLLASDPSVGEKGNAAVIGFGLLGSIGAVLGGAIGSQAQTDVWVAVATAPRSGDHGGAPVLSLRLQRRPQR